MFTELLSPMDLARLPETEARTERNGRNGKGRDGTGRNGTERDGTGRNGTERDGTGRNGTERNGTGRNGTERNGTEQNRTERFILYFVDLEAHIDTYEKSLSWGSPTYNYYKLVMFLIIQLYISYADIIISVRIHRNVAKNEVRYRP